MLLADVLRGHADERPDAPMLVTPEQTLTYGEADARANRVAQALLAEGVRPGDRVAFLDKNGPEYFDVLFGAAKVGAVDVAVNWRLSPAEMAFIVEDSAAPVFVVGAEFAPLLAEMARGLTRVRRVLVIGGDGREQDYAGWRDAAPAEDPRLPAAETDVVMQLYTSGTTGTPKGAMLTHANLSQLAPNVSVNWGLDATSVSLVAMPLFHIGGSGWALVGIWYGCPSILVRDFVPGPVLEVLESRRVTHAFLVPAVLQFLTAVPGAADRDWSALRTIVYGASPITDSVLVRAMETFRCDFVQVYGLTETTGAITQLDTADHDPGGPRAHLLRSAGRAYPWVELRIADVDSGEELPPGHVGELWTRSAQNTVGYWHRPEDTAAAVTEDGWFRTGDAGYLDAEGYLFLTDRLKDMIVSAAENVYPIEVENVLADHPAVAEVAVIGVPHEKWGETVKAVVVKSPGAEVTERELIDFAKSRLARFKAPTSIDWVAALPRNPSGKVLKRQLREPYWAGRDRRVG